MVKRLFIATSPEGTSLTLLCVLGTQKMYNAFFVLRTVGKKAEI